MDETTTKKESASEFVWYEDLKTKMRVADEGPATNALQLLLSDGTSARLRIDDLQTLRCLISKLESAI